MWRQRKWRQLLNLIDHLPRASFYIQAITMDEEYAAAVSGQPIDRPRALLSDYSPEVELLAAVFDRLGELINVQIMRGQGKAQSLEPWPRPVTAMQVLEDRSKRDQHRRLVERMVPK